MNLHAALCLVLRCRTGLMLLLAVGAMLDTMAQLLSQPQVPFLTGFVWPWLVRYTARALMLPQSVRAMLVIVALYPQSPTLLFTAPIALIRTRVSGVRVEMRVTSTHNAWT